MDLLIRSQQVLGSSPSAGSKPVNNFAAEVSRAEAAWGNTGVTRGGYAARFPPSLRPPNRPGEAKVLVFGR
jgi:hypothetical protein